MFVLTRGHHVCVDKSAPCLCWLEGTMFVLARGHHVCVS